MAKGLRIDLKNTQTKLNFDVKTRMVVDFLNENYKLLVPVHDPDKIQIIYNGTDNRYKYTPSFDDLSMHIEESGISISDTSLWKIIKSPNYIEPYNPIRDYFDSIRGKFKGESHIDLLCRHLTPRCFNDNTPEYYRERCDKLIRKWMVACVACWMNGIPNPVALGLICNKGGIGKSHFTKFIIPEALSEYYISPSRNDKVFDMEESYVRYMMINYEELEGINKRTINTFKKVQTDSWVLTRFPRERTAVNRQRLACSIFTTNKSQEAGGFILESYGDSRRFGCIELDPYGIDWEYSKLVDVDQLWSEALNLFEGTVFDYEFKMPDFDEFVNYNCRYAYESTAMSYIQTYFSIPDGDEEGQKMNAGSIIKHLIDTKKIKREDLGPKNDKVNARTIGFALSSLSYQYMSFRSPGVEYPLHGWHVKINE